MPKRDNAASLATSSIVCAILRLATLRPTCIREVAHRLQRLQRRGCRCGYRRLRLQWCSSMSAPFQREVAEDDASAGQVDGRGNYFCRSPSVRLHDARGVARILDGVLSFRLDENGRGRNTPRRRRSRHHLGLNESVVCGSSGEYQPRRQAVFILVNTLRNARQLFRRRVSVAICGTAEYKDGIEMLHASVRSRRKLAGQSGPDQKPEDQQHDGNDEPPAPAHPVHLDRFIAVAGPAGRRTSLQLSGLSRGRQRRTSSLHSTALSSELRLMASYSLWTPESAQLRGFIPGG